MKITLEIPNEHAPALLALLSDLMPVRLEPQADPAEGHPELPLATGMSVEEWSASRLAKPDDESEEIAETRWAPVPHRFTTECHKCGGGTCQEDPCVCGARFAAPGIDAADPLKVEMEAEDARPRLIPKPGKYYLTRHGLVIHAERITLNGDIECNCDDGPFYYLPDGTPRAAVVCSPEWDVVEECLLF